MLILVMVVAEKNAQKLSGNKNNAHPGGVGDVGPDYHDGDNSDGGDSGGS